MVPAGAATTAAFSSATLLGKDITDSGFLGTLAAACVTIGGAVATVPIANHMSHHGRRAGLRLGWLIAVGGAALALGAAILDFYPLLLVGGVLLGCGSSTNLSARYAAADLAPESGRAKAIGLLVWAGSFGSVLGPTLGLGWAGTAAEWVGLPELAGPYLMAIALFAMASVWIDRRLRPDPLEAAGGIVDAGSAPHTSFLSVLRAARQPLGAITRDPSARLAATAMLVGHAVMVGIMTATPLHMDDGNHELQIVGFVVSLHIVGMYFFAPAVGWVVDRFSARPVIALGGVTLFIGAELAAHTAAEDRLGVFVGLFLIGLGWSFGLIAGSTLLTSSFAASDRVPVQGAADLLMSGSGAAAALTGGVLYEIASYHDLSHYAGLAAVGLAVAALWSMLGRGGVQRRTRPATSKVPSGRKLTPLSPSETTN